MPVREIACRFEVLMIGIGLDVLVAGHPWREVLVERLARVWACLSHICRTVDGVVHGLAHVRVREQRALRVQREVADAVAGLREELLEPPCGGRAIWPVQ